MFVYIEYVRNFGEVLPRKKCDPVKCNHINCRVLKEDKRALLLRLILTKSTKGIVRLPTKFVSPGISLMRTSIKVGLEMPFLNICKKNRKVFKI